MPFAEIHGRIENSTYKTWQLYFLLASITACTGIHYNIGPIIYLLQTVEHATASLEWIVILGIQGVLVGFAAEYLYEQGDGYAKAGSPLFGSKDRILAFRIGVMTFVAAVITLVVPELLENHTEYLALQTTGAVITAGILLIHEDSSDWNRSTEAPAIIAGILLAVGPTVL